MAAAATMFAACSETDFVNEAAVQDAPQVIGFETFSNKLTRTEFTKPEDLQSVGFNVWGYTATETVFAGDDVTWNDSKWECETKKYWDKTATYNFYATAPKDAGAEWDNTDDKFTISSAKSGESTSTDVIDYLTAIKTGVTRENNGTTADASVEFDFNHVMSKVSLALAKSTNVEGTLKVTSVTMTGWNSNEGSYDSKATPAWSITEGTAGSATFVSTNAEAASETGTTATTVATSYLIVPQTVDKLTFTVSYELGDLTYTNQTATLENQTWAVNQHTTYTLTIGPELITFGVNDVNGWTNADPQPSGSVQ